MCKFFYKVLPIVVLLLYFCSLFMHNITRACVCAAVCGILNFSFEEEYPEQMPSFTCILAFSYYALALDNMLSFGLLFSYKSLCILYS